MSGDGRGIDGWASQVKIHICGQGDHVLFVFSFDFAILGTLKRKPELITRCYKGYKVHIKVLLESKLGAIKQDRSYFDSKARLVMLNSFKFTIIVQQKVPQTRFIKGFKKRGQCFWILYVHVAPQGIASKYYSDAKLLQCAQTRLF